MREPEEPSEQRAPYDPMPHGPPEVGVGPWPGERPDGEQYDPELLATATGATSSTATATGRVEAIVADLDTRRHDFHVAIENWQHDLNIGTVVRNANAFLAAEVHIVGRRRWNRRGAMVTDRYQHVRHHPDVEDLADCLAGRGAGSRCRASTTCPARCRWRRPTLPRAACLLFGQEGPGLSDAARAAVRWHLLDRPVRLDPVDQRRRGNRDRDARLDPGARRPVGFRRVARLSVAALPRFPRSTSGVHRTSLRCTGA